MLFSEHVTFYARLARENHFGNSRWQVRASLSFVASSTHLLLLEIFTIASIPATYWEYVRDRRAAKILRLRNFFKLRESLPLTVSHHCWMEVYEDLFLHHDTLMQRLFSLPAPEQPSKGELPAIDEDVLTREYAEAVKIRFDTIAVEMTKRYPFMSLKYGHRSTNLEYHGLWEVKAYGIPNPYPGYVEPPDAGYNDIRLRIEAEVPTWHHAIQRDYPEGTDFSWACDPKKPHICVSYVYDNGYDGGCTWYRDRSEAIIFPWTNTDNFFATAAPLIDNFYGRVMTNNMHMNFSFILYDRVYWKRLERHVAALKTFKEEVRAAGPTASVVAGWVAGSTFSSAVLGAVDGEQVISMLDPICMDRGDATAVRTRPSKTPFVALLRCALRCSRLLVISTLTHTFDEANLELAKRNHCVYDCFIRGTTTETNWRTHFHLEPGVGLERALIEQRKKVGLLGIRVKNAHLALWPLWALELVPRLVRTWVDIAVVSLALKTGQIDILEAKRRCSELLSSSNGMQETNPTSEALSRCLNLLGLE